MAAQEQVKRPQLEQQPSYEQLLEPPFPVPGEAPPGGFYSDESSADETRAITERELAAAQAHVQKMLDGSYGCGDSEGSSIDERVDAAEDEQPLRELSSTRGAGHGGTAVTIRVQAKANAVRDADSASVNDSATRRRRRPERGAPLIRSATERPGGFLRKRSARALQFSPVAPPKPLSKRATAHRIDRLMARKHKSHHGHGLLRQSSEMSELEERAAAARKAANQARLSGTRPESRMEVTPAVSEKAIEFLQANCTRGKTIKFADDSAADGFVARRSVVLDIDARAVLPAERAAWAEVAATSWPAAADVTHLHVRGPELTDLGPLMAVFENTMVLKITPGPRPERGPYEPDPDDPSTWRNIVPQSAWAVPSRASDIVEMFHKLRPLTKLRAITFSGFREIEGLGAIGNPLGNLLAANERTLQKLDIRKNNMDESGLETIGRTIGRFHPKSPLSEMRVSGNAHKAARVSLLASLWERFLRVDPDEIGEAAAAAAARMAPSDVPLADRTALTMDKVQLGRGREVAVTGVLQLLPRLTAIDITDSDVSLLERMLPAELYRAGKLHRLNLSGCNLSDKGISFLAMALDRNECLKKLDLSNIHLSPRAIDSLCVAFATARTCAVDEVVCSSQEVKTVVRLRRRFWEENVDLHADLPSEMLQPHDMPGLLRLIRDAAGMKTLDLSGNILKTSAIQEITGALLESASADTLKEVDLSGVDLRDDAAFTLSELLGAHATLSGIQIADNPHLSRRAAMTIMGAKAGTVRDRFKTKARLLGALTAAGKAKEPKDERNRQKKGFLARARMLSMGSKERSLKSIDGQSPRGSTAASPAAASAASPGGKSEAGGASPRPPSGGVGWAAAGSLDAAAAGGILSGFGIATTDDPIDDDGFIAGNIGADAALEMGEAVAGAIDPEMAKDHGVKVPAINCDHLAQARFSPEIGGILRTSFGASLLVFTALGFDESKRGTFEGTVSGVVDSLKLVRAFKVRLKKKAGAARRAVSERGKVKLKRGFSQDVAEDRTALSEKAVQSFVGMSMAVVVPSFISDLPPLPAGTSIIGPVVRCFSDIERMVFEKQGARQSILRLKHGMTLTEDTAHGMSVLFFEGYPEGGMFTYRKPRSSYRWEVLDSNKFKVMGDSVEVPVSQVGFYCVAWDGDYGKPDQQVAVHLLSFAPMSGWGPSEGSIPLVVWALPVEDSHRKWDRLTSAVCDKMLKRADPLTVSGATVEPVTCFAGATLDVDAGIRSGSCILDRTKAVRVPELRLPQRAALGMTQTEHIRITIGRAPESSGSPVRHSKAAAVIFLPAVIKIVQRRPPKPTRFEVDRRDRYKTVFVIDVRSPFLHEHGPERPFLYGAGVTPAQYSEGGESLESRGEEFTYERVPFVASTVPGRSDQIELSVDNIFYSAFFRVCMANDFGESEPTHCELVHPSITSITDRLNKNTRIDFVQEEEVLEVIEKKAAKETHRPPMAKARLGRVKVLKRIDGVISALHKDGSVDVDLSDGSKLQQVDPTTLFRKEESTSASSAGLVHYVRIKPDDNGFVAVLVGQEVQATHWSVLPTKIVTVNDNGTVDLKDQSGRVFRSVPTKHVQSKAEEDAPLADGDEVELRVSVDDDPEDDAEDDAEVDPEELETYQKLNAEESEAIEEMMHGRVNLRPGEGLSTVARFRELWDTKAHGLSTLSKRARERTLNEGRIRRRLLDFAANYWDRSKGGHDPSVIWGWWEHVRRKRIKAEAPWESAKFKKIVTKVPVHRLPWDRGDDPTKPYTPMPVAKPEPSPDEYWLLRVWTPRLPTPSRLQLHTPLPFPQLSFGSLLHETVLEEPPAKPEEKGAGGSRRGSRRSSGSRRRSRSRRSSSRGSSRGSASCGGGRSRGRSRQRSPQRASRGGMARHRICRVCNHGSLPNSVVCMHCGLAFLSPPASRLDSRLGSASAQVGPLGAATFLTDGIVEEEERVPGTPMRRDRQHDASTASPTRATGSPVRGFLQPSPQPRKPKQQESTRAAGSPRKKRVSVAASGKPKRGRSPRKSKARTGSKSRSPRKSKAKSKSPQRTSLLQAIISAEGVVKKEHKGAGGSKGTPKRRRARRSKRKGRKSRKSRNGEATDDDGDRRSAASRSSRRSRRSRRSQRSRGSRRSRRSAPSPVLVPGEEVDLDPFFDFGGGAASSQRAKARAAEKQAAAERMAAIRKMRQEKLNAERVERARHQAEMRAKARQKANLDEESYSRAKEQLVSNPNSADEAEFSEVRRRTRKKRKAREQLKKNRKERERRRAEMEQRDKLVVTDSDDSESELSDASESVAAGTRRSHTRKSGAARRSHRRSASPTSGSASPAASAPASGSSESSGDDDARPASAAGTSDSSSSGGMSSGASVEGGHDSDGGSTSNGSASSGSTSSDADGSDSGGEGGKEAGLDLDAASEIELKQALAALKHAAGKEVPNESQKKRPVPLQLARVMEERPPGSAGSTRSTRSSQHDKLAEEVARELREVIDALNEDSVEPRRVRALLDVLQVKHKDIRNGTSYEVMELRERALPYITTLREHMEERDKRRRARGGGSFKLSDTSLPPGVAEKGPPRLLAEFVDNVTQHLARLPLTAAAKGTKSFTFSPDKFDSGSAVDSVDDLDLESRSVTTRPTPRLSGAVSSGSTSNNFFPPLSSPVEMPESETSPRPPSEAHSDASGGAGASFSALASPKSRRVSSAFGGRQRLSSMDSVTEGRVDDEWLERMELPTGMRFLEIPFGMCHTDAYTAINVPPLVRQEENQRLMAVALQTLTRDAQECMMVFDISAANVWFALEAGDPGNAARAPFAVLVLRSAKLLLRRAGMTKVHTVNCKELAKFFHFGIDACQAGTTPPPLPHCLNFPNSGHPAFVCVVTAFKSHYRLALPMLTRLIRLAVKLHRFFSVFIERGWLAYVASHDRPMMKLFKKFDAEIIKIYDECPFPALAAICNNMRVPRMYKNGKCCALPSALAGRQRAVLTSCCRCSVRWRDVTRAQAAAQLPATGVGQLAERGSGHRAGGRPADADDGGADAARGAAAAGSVVRRRAAQGTAPPPPPAPPPHAAGAARGGRHIGRGTGNAANVESQFILMPAGIKTCRCAA